MKKKSKIPVMYASAWYWRDGSYAVRPTMKIGSKGWTLAMQQVEAKLSDPTYKIVKQQRVWWGGLVSTVWLGLDHSFDAPVPLFFETMVFFPYPSEVDMDRYSSEESAVKGHARMYKKWSNPITVLRHFPSIINNIKWQWRFRKAFPIWRKNKQ